MKYYIIAGERSGDLHGGNLIKSLKNSDPLAIFRVWGGDYMKSAGADLVMHYNDLAFMGFLEVVLNFRKILKNLDHCRNDIVKFKPDVLILIDFAGFNFKIAKFAHQQGFRIFYYISPKIWAWNTKRVYKIKSWVERMFVILPFEKDFYQQYGVEVDYVGNPVAQAVHHHKVDKIFADEIRNKAYDKIVALLPGSRRQELLQSLPLMVHTAKHFPDVLFLVAGVNNLPNKLYDICKEVNNVQVVFEKAYDILSISHAAIVTSGTATLETALWKVPQVVVYKANLRISYWIARMVIKVRFISLVNLIAGEEVVKELIQDNLNEVSLKNEFHKILNDESTRNGILNAYDKIDKELGQQVSSDTAAGLMIRYLRKAPR